MGFPNNGTKDNRKYMPSAEEKGIFFDRTIIFNRIAALQWKLFYNR